MTMFTKRLGYQKAEIQHRINIHGEGFVSKRSFLTCPNAETASTRAAAIVGASVPLTFGEGTGFRKSNS